MPEPQMSLTYDDICAFPFIDHALTVGRPSSGSSLPTDIVSVNVGLCPNDGHELLVPFLRKLAPSEEMWRAHQSTLTAYRFGSQRHTVHMRGSPRAGSENRWANLRRGLCQRRWYVRSTTPLHTPIQTLPIDSRPKPPPLSGFQVFDDLWDFRPAVRHTLFNDFAIRLGATMRI